MALADGFATLPQDVEGVPAWLYPARHVLPRFEVSGITSPEMLKSAGTLIRQADVVHVHLMRDLVTTPVAAMAALVRHPLVLQTHGMIDPTREAFARWVDLIAVRSLLRRADALVYLTSSERQGVEAVAGRPLAQATRLVNGVPLQSRETRVITPPVVLFLARFQTRKRPNHFIAAIPEILARHPDARFVLAGPDSGALAGALELAGDLGVQERLGYLGPLDHSDALDQMRRASVYVLPSYDETFPVSVLESLSVGTPVVVSPTNGLADDVATTGAGRVAEGPSAVAAAVVELLDAEANSKASAAGMALIEDTYSLDAVVRRLMTVYDTVLSKGGRAGRSP
jgi:glycosyltransferase involved in cell wall biosynthesis